MYKQNFTFMELWKMLSLGKLDVTRIFPPDSHGCFAAGGVEHSEPLLLRQLPIAVLVSPGEDSTDLKGVKLSFLSIIQF